MAKDSDVAISVQDVHKNFVLPHQRANTLKSHIINPLNWFQKKFENEKQKALDGISFEVKKGEFFGIVGRNGSGKSTLLKCLAGVYTPSSGSIQVNGTLVPFIELGVGFNPELSGRDNVYLNGALLGFNRDEMDAMYDEIVAFSELEKFMDQKLKNYSSGMQVRLAFSIAIRAKGDILLLDEVLAVGDSLFQQKCFNYFNQLKKERKTILLVSHNESVLRQYCTSGVLIESGKIVCEGKIEKVVNEYIDLISEREGVEVKSTTALSKNQGGFKRHGTGKVMVRSIEVNDEKGDKKSLFTDEDENVFIEVEYSAVAAVEQPVYGIVVKDGAGANILSSNNLWFGEKSKSLDEEGTEKVTWRLPNIFNTGQYTISPAVADSMGQEMYDWVDDMVTFKVRKKTGSSGLVNPPHEMTMESAASKTGKEI